MFSQYLFRFMPRYFTFFRITLIFEPRKIFYSATGAHYYRTDPNSVFFLLRITGWIYYGSTSIRT
jgi:hypothetical protein